MNVTLSTNGMHADAGTALALRDAGLEEIQVSIHGTRGVHDKLVRLPGAFERTVVGLRNLVEAGLRVSVASVGMKSNFGCLPELARLTAEAGAKYFRLLRLMPHSPELLAEIIPSGDMISLCSELLQIQGTATDFTVRIHSSPGLDDERYWSASEHQLVHPLCHTCSAGKVTMGILSNGDCVPCVELKGQQFHCGNILQGTLEDIWNAPAMQDFRGVKPEKFGGRCGACEAKWTCYSARCVAFHLDGDVLADDRTCYRLTKLNSAQE